MPDVSRAEKPQVAIADVERWLAARHAGVAITGLTPLAGGFWSSAYAYRAGDDELVLRLGDMDEGYRIDEAAMRFASPDLPVPALLARGHAFDGFFAISRRHYGRFIETAPEAEASAIGNAMARLLRALRAAPVKPDEGVTWYEPGAKGSTTWHDWLRGGITDDGAARTGGWREKLRAKPRIDALFRSCESRIHGLLPSCPERRDLVHSDLLHQNVLVADDDPSRVTAVFSWKCSARGDFLYDVAWCTVWSPWHPAIAGANLWQRTLEAPDLGDTDLADAPLRHHCYELQIAAAHLGWYARIDDDHEQNKLADVIDGILERGPLATPPPRGTSPARR